MELPAFKYSPISHEQPFIRLLEVSSSHPNEIVYKLSVVSLAEKPEFIALSYCWGRDAETFDLVFLDSQAGRATFTVTKSVKQFLDQFIASQPAASSSPRLWIDAICINQKDDHEKSLQVGMMSKIYQMAEDVLVWLGQGTVNTHAGMKMIPELLAAEKRVGELGYESDDNFRYRKHKLKNLGFPEDALDIRDFIWLCDSEWFSRVWIIQEVAMASKDVRLTCGSYSITWTEFIEAFFFLHGTKLDVIIPDQARAVRAGTRITGILDARESRTNGYELDLLSTLVRCRSSLATDPKDKLFAILGLVTDTMGVAVDYEMKTGQVYTNLAFTILEHERNLDFLGIPQGPTEKSKIEELLPSWTVDWSVWDSTVMLNGRDRPARNEDTPTYEYVRNATNRTASKPELSADGLLLGLQGYVLDELAEIGVLCESSDSLIDYTMWIIDVLKQAKQETQAFLDWEQISGIHTKGTYHPTGEPILEAYWKTLTAGRRPNDQTFQPSSSKYLKWDDFYRPGRALRRLVGPAVARSSFFAWLTLGFNILKQNFMGLPETDFDHVHSIIANRRFVKTARGYIGLGPAGATKGDLVALFKGGGSPLVIRIHGVNWKLIGEGYVHGMMNAEQWREQKCSQMWLA